MQDAIVQGVLARSAQGDPSLAAAALKLMRKDDTDYDELMDQLVEAMAPPEPDPAQGGGAMEAIQGAESLARGGIPGNAEQAPSPSGLGLPPLGGILGQDSRQIS